MPTAILPNIQSRGALATRRAFVRVAHCENENAETRAFLKDIGVVMHENIQPIHASGNLKTPVHRWSPYIQGFASEFVRGILADYKNNGAGIRILDPFVGSGTVAIEAKMRGFDSCGIEINPLLRFVAKTKSESFRADLDLLRQSLKQVVSCKKKSESPDFLRTEDQFDPEVLQNLRRIKAGIDRLPNSRTREKIVRNLILLAFASILVECSRMVRSPCLTYRLGKQVAANAPISLIQERVGNIAQDIEEVRRQSPKMAAVPCRILCENSISFQHDEDFDLVITSPPYMNGMDYVINYKIEMAWLGFVKSQKELKAIKDAMVVCDNVSRGMIRDFSKGDSYSHPRISEIKEEISRSIRARGRYRRVDMHQITHKYFDDMHAALKNTVSAIKSGGRLVMVVGDSLIAGVYVPTDLILAQMGQEMGLTVERIEKARKRRSGQNRSYQLRESIIVLRKP